MNDTKDLFMKALSKGFENANNADKFIVDLKAMIVDANASLAKIKKDEVSEITFSIVDLHDSEIMKRLITNPYSCRIVVNVNGDRHECIRIISLSQGFRIEYNRESHILDFPNIDDFEELFKNYLSSSNFGEIIYHSVDKEKMQ